MGVGYIDSFFEYVRMLHYSILKKRFKLILKNRNRKITRKQEKKIRVNSLQLVRRTRIFRITKNLRTRIFRITKNLRTRKFISKNSRKTPNYQIKNVKLTYRKALYRRSYIRGRFFRNRSRKYRYKKKLKYALKKIRKLHPRIRFAHIHIKLRRRNTFLICRKGRNRTILALSTGTFKYTGRIKSFPFARERLAKVFAQKIKKRHYRFVDIHFVSKMGRFYRIIVKAFVNVRLFIRMLHIKKIHSHGMIRPKKAKRK